MDETPYRYEVGTHGDNTRVAPVDVTVTDDEYPTLLITQTGNDTKVTEPTSRVVMGDGQVIADGQVIVDGGTGLKPEGQVVHPDLTVTDGPFAEAKELVGGFSIVEADSLAAAVGIAKTSPMPAGGGSVEVREFMDYGIE